MLYADRGSYSEVISIGTANVTEIVIADEYNGKPVTAIGYAVFNGCTALTNITIPSTVQTIGYSAFSGCIGLTGNFKIPDGIVTIEGSAFDGCTGLTSIEIPKNVTSIGNRAFANCTNLERITVDGNNGYYSSYGGILYNKAQTEFVGVPLAITVLDGTNMPESITSIGTETFADSSLTSVTLHEGVTFIGSQAFGGCSNLTQVTLPDSIETIFSDAFINCAVESATLASSALQYVRNTALKTVIITSGESIADSAFQGYTNIESVQLPAGLKTIGENAFKGCTGITGITIPDSVTAIGKYAFENCSNLESVMLYEGLKTICISAFNGCSSLTSIILPKGLESIETQAFASTGLTSITIPDSVTYTSDIFGYGCAIETASIPAVAIESMRWTQNSLKSLTITSGECIGESDDFYVSQAFSGFTNLQSVVIYESVEIIGNNAFKGCSSLTSLTLPEGVSIRNSAFLNCSNLTSVIIPENVSIGDGAFSGCGLTSITIPDSVTEVGNGAFNGCPIETAIIPAHAVWSVHNGLLQKVVITSGESLRDGAFNGGSNPTSAFPNLVSVTLPEGLKTIGERAFYNCTALSSINIPQSVTSIGEQAFYKCTGLTTVIIPDNMTKIANGTFWECTGLTSIVIPVSVAEIGDSAFNFCTNLNICYKGTAEEWADVTIGISNNYITSGKIFYYSETEQNGNYWHYVDGEPVIRTNED